jgi:hypothetical protein
MALPELTHEELLNPQSCKQCHPKHYEQWSASMHAYAAQDPVFVAMNTRGQEETNGALGTFCINCHAPMAVREGAITNNANLDDVPGHLKGVTCYFCHNAVGVGPSHNNGMVNIANDNVMRGAIRNAIEPSTHKVAYSKFHDPRTDESSDLCGTCHDILTPKNVALERTYLEYKSSNVGATDLGVSHQSCQDCHMARADGGKRPIAEMTGRPGELVNARDFHPHLWPAVDVALTDWPHADAMRSAVGSCELPGAISYITLERDPGPLGEITVNMETQAGHNFPSGATQDRRLWLELVAYDASNTELFRIGQIGDQDVEEPHDAPHPCMFREYLLDDNGKETHDFWEAASIDDRSRQMPVAPRGGTNLPGSHSASCNVRPPLAQAAATPAFIDVRLRMRPMGIDVLQDLVSTGHLAPDIVTKMPTFTALSRRFTYDPKTRGYTSDPNHNDPTLGDCRTFWCLLDPNGKECTAP